MKLECPSCGANVKYIIGTHQVLCTHCNEKFDIDSLTKKLYSSGNNINNSEIQEFHCSSCGAKFVSMDNSIIKICNFCGSENLTKSTLHSKIVTRKIIPFEITKEQMIKKFKDYIKYNPVSNSKFFNEDKIQKITGLYIPVKVCNYDANFHAYSNLILSFDTEPFEFHSEYKATITVDCLKDYPNIVFKNLLPYNLNKSVTYSPYYLIDYFAITGNDFYKPMIKASKTDISDKLFFDMEQIFRYMHFSDSPLVKPITFPNKKEQFLLELNTTSSDNYFFPVWTCSYKYNNKEYTFAINGQTGKVVADLPLDNIKAKKFTKDFLAKDNLFFILFISLAELMAGMALALDKLETGTFNPVIIIIMIMFFIVPMLFKMTDRSVAKGEVDKNRSSVNPDYNKYIEFVSVGNTNVKYSIASKLYTYKENKDKLLYRTIPDITSYRANNITKPNSSVKITLYTSKNIGSSSTIDVNRRYFNKLYYDFKKDGVPFDIEIDNEKL